jgi:ABC-type polar amino acid transport system ATPase subunit
MILKNLSRSITDDFGLKNISFTVPDNSIVTFIGKSGSGKSTLLRCLAGLEHYKVEHEQKPKQIGFVFQSSNLFSHLTLEENILLALIKVQKKTHHEALQICDRVLSQVKMEHRKNFKPHQLSGGQQQRGAIARALSLKPELILYDEPTSALDPELVDELFDLMLDLKSTGLKQIVVTHEKSAVRKISNYVRYVHNGELKLFDHFKNLSTHMKDLSLEEQKYLKLFI